MTVQQRQRLDLRAEPASVREARRFVTRVLTDWDFQDAVEVVALLVSELATNAVLHARTAYAVVVSQAGGAIRVEVLDGSEVAPRHRQNSTSAATGRGVAMMNRLALSWGTQQGAEGFAKAVWFTVPAIGAPAALWTEEVL